MRILYRRPNRLSARGSGPLARTGADLELRRRAASAAARRRRDLRRASPPWSRHRRLQRPVRGARTDHGQVRHLAGVHVLHGRAGPRTGVSGPQRQDLARCRAFERPAGSVRPPRPDWRGPDRRGHPLPRSRRARDQAPSQGAALRAERRAVGARVRARRRAPGSHPDPRGARVASDRRPPPPARRAPIPTRS